MPSINEIQIGQRFSFEVYPSSVLGNNFKDVRLEGRLSARLAISYGVDVVSMHANVYPTLPAGTPNDPMQYEYIRIQYPSGEFMVLGVPYIRPETIMVSTGGIIDLSFQDKTQADLERILQALSANGFKPDLVNLRQP